MPDATPRPDVFRTFRRGLFGLSLGLLTLVFACGDEVAHESPAAAAEASTVALSGSGYVLEDGASGETEPAAATRQLIHDAEVHLEVESCEEARRAVVAEVARVGG